MVVRMFLDQVDLNGKTVIPYTTHEGSGLGSTTAILVSISTFTLYHWKKRMVFLEEVMKANNSVEATENTRFGMTLVITLLSYFVILMDNSIVFTSSLQIGES